MLATFCNLWLRITSADLPDMCNLWLHDGATRLGD
jgi:hypothetical protein